MEDDQVEDRKATIEAAFDQLSEASSETSTSASPTKEGAGEAAAPATEDGAAQGEQASEGSSAPAAVAEADPAAAEAVAPEKEFSVDKAPQSWRAAQKQKWAELPTDVRQEVIRREREITRTLGETAQARQFVNEFTKTIQPFEARIRSAGIHPLAAVSNLVQSDYFLSTAPTQQRAQFMAKLIKDYGIDVQALDAALAGTVQAADPVAEQVERMLQERLSPLQQFLAQQQAQQQAAAAQESQRVAMTVEQMAADNVKYPHFDQVREDMADLVEIQAKKGLYLSLEQAYNRAIAMNPEISQKVAQQEKANADTVAARMAHARAQKAQKASLSVGGAPSGKASGASVASGDRRAQIEAAFEQAAGR